MLFLCLIPSGRIDFKGVTYLFKRGNSVINLFSPGGVSSPDVLERDDLAFENIEQAHERKLAELFGDSIIPDDVEQLFIAFAEIYFSPEHLDEVALYHDFMDWDSMKESIIQNIFTVPNIRTPNGLNEARRLLLEDQLYR